jgi:hypothetical protein
MKSTPKQILEKISKITAMERGTICPMKRKNKTYYNHQTWQKGGNTSRYVNSENLPELKKALEGYQLFQKLCEQYADLIVTQTRKTLHPRKKTQPRLGS